MKICNTYIAGRFAIVLTFLVQASALNAFGQQDSNQKKVRCLRYDTDYFSSFYSGQYLNGINGGFTAEFNNKLSIGMNLSWLNSKRVYKPELFPVTAPRFNNWNLGLLIEYNFFPAKKFSAIPFFKAGGGEVLYKDITEYASIIGTPVPNPSPIYKNLMKDSYVFGEPGIRLQFDLSLNWAISLAGGYRAIYKTGGYGEDPDLTGPSFYIGAKFRFLQD